MIEKLGKIVFHHLERLGDEIEVDEITSPITLMGKMTAEEMIPAVSFEDIADEATYPRMGGINLYFHHMWNKETPSLEYSLKLAIQSEPTQTPLLYKWQLSIEQVMERDAENKMIPIPMKQWVSKGVFNVD